MKRLILLLLLVAGLAHGATMTNYLTDGFGNPVSTRVVITPYFPSTVFGGTNVLGPSTAVNCTNGFWQQALLGGFYYVQQGSLQPQINIFAVPGDMQTNCLAYFASAATNPLPSFFFSGTGVFTNYVLIVSNSLIVISNLVATNIVFVNAYQFTNVWLGPTNTIDLQFGRQTYFTVTPVSVTNILSAGTNTINEATLDIVNNSGSNVTFTLTSTFESKDGLRQYTITNGQDWMIAIQYDPSTRRTNTVNAIQF